MFTFDNNSETPIVHHHYNEHRVHTANETIVSATTKANAVFSFKGFLCADFIFLFTFLVSLLLPFLRFLLHLFQRGIQFKCLNFVFENFFFLRKSIELRPEFQQSFSAMNTGLKM